MRWAEPPSWRVTIADLLPFWLLTFAILAEGFPKPPISAALGVTAFVLAIVLSIILLWVGWLTPDLLLYSLFPIILMFRFDEIHTGYKTPFILLCAFLLTAGIVGYQYGLKRFNSVRSGWVILLLVAIATWMLATNARQNYWQMLGDFDFGACFPDAEGCPPMTGQETPWWVLFFSV